MNILAAYDERQMIVLSGTSVIERQFLEDLGYYLKSEESYRENGNEIRAEYWQRPDVPHEFQTYIEMLGLVDQQNPYGGHDIYTKDHKFVAEYNNQKERWNIFSFLSGMIYERRAHGSKEEREACAEKCSEIGTYDCCINVPGTNLYCDKCVATEVRILNEMGIKTIGCCCGHGKVKGYIQVAPEFCEKMKEIGYIEQPVDEYGNGCWCFEPKSILFRK